jgi:hypothetical protein
MTIVAPIGAFPGRALVMDLTDLGVRSTKSGVFGRQRLPTEPIGTFTLILTNVVVGSAVLVEDQAGTTTFYNGTAAAAQVTLSLSAYAAGSSLNDLRIRVRKGSASPYYQPWETLATAVIGSASIYVAQVSDE